MMNGSNSLPLLAIGIILNILSGERLVLRYPRRTAAKCIPHEYAIKPPVSSDLRAETLLAGPNSVWYAISKTKAV